MEYTNVRLFTHVRIGLFVLLVFGIALAPNLASATAPPTDTATWNFYQYQDQIAAYQDSVTLPAAHITIQIKNTTNHSIDSIGANVPNLASCMTITAVTTSLNNGSPDPNIVSATCDTGISGFNAALNNFNSGSTLNIYLTVNIGCIKTTTYPYGCNNEPNLTTSADWVLHMYHWQSSNPDVPFSNDIAVGNVQLNVMTNPGASTAQPLNFGTKNPYGDAINGSGINDINMVKGLLPPGPIDSLLTFPITEFQIIIAAASGSPIAPTFTLFGYNATLPPGQTFWNTIPSPIPIMASTMFILLTSFAWIRSVYERLQRASQFNTQTNDTWGKL